MNKPFGQIQPRDVIQFTDGELRGLLAQIVSVEGDKLTCLARDFEGSPHFFGVSASSSAFTLIGVAALGPKPKASVETSPEPAPQAQEPAPEAQAPALPPPLNAEELLEPLPPEVKPVPMVDDAGLPPALHPIPPIAQRRPPKPRPAKVSRHFAYATVTNGHGDKADVKVNVEDGRRIKAYNGIATMKAKKIIPDITPFNVEWTKP